MKVFPGYQPEIAPLLSERVLEDNGAGIQELLLYLAYAGRMRLSECGILRTVLPDLRFHLLVLRSQAANPLFQFVNPLYSMRSVQQTSFSVVLGIQLLPNYSLAGRQLGSRSSVDVCPGLVQKYPADRGPCLFRSPRRPAGRSCQPHAVDITASARSNIEIVIASLRREIRGPQVVTYHLRDATSR